jgi:very-short-patch-repair endonuclease
VCHKPPTRPPPKGGGASKGSFSSRKTEMVYSRRVNDAKHVHGASLNIKAKAKELRLNMTKAEKKLWERIKRKQLYGMHFRRQHPYGIYIIDFFCDKANLAIEVDGDIHLLTGEYDTEKTRYLESAGLKVLRFKNEEVETEIDEVMDRIINCLGA